MNTRTSTVIDTMLLNVADSRAGNMYDLDCRIIESGSF